METNIHAPSDNRQLADGVGVLTRIVQKIHKLRPASQAVGEDLTQAAGNVSRKIGETLRQRSEEAKEAAGKQLYQQLIEMTQTSVTHAQRILEQIGAQTQGAEQRLKRQLEKYVPLVKRVIDQTQRRILEKEAVPAQEKVVSLFEPHSDIIVRGKDNKPVEYGHKIWLNEVDGGIVSHYRILKGNPSDELQWEPSLQAHQKSFHSPPEQASADRGVSSTPNEQIAKDL
ncbi:MAG TPA: ISNCY family transposase, partial [Anaerolineaceae bacterium]|nr:ISNCY family transposase [Anaerolineaceae bacterium]